MKKRLVSIVCIALIMSFTSIPALSAGAFSDVPADHTFYSGIMDCASKGITSGYDDGTFRPSNPVTRAQFCVMLSRAFYSDQIEVYNTDLYKTNWFGPNAKALSVNGVLKNTSMEYGFGEASIMNQNISRYDMAQLMTNIMNNNNFAANDSQKASIQNKITDYGSIPAKYKNAVKNVYALGIITGYADGKFNGDANMNRGQGCIVIYRMLQFVPGNTGNSTGNTDNPVTIPDTPKTEQPTTQTAGTLTNGKPITEENVKEMLDELKAQYPNGSQYAPIGTAIQTRVYGGARGKECAGWAALVSDTIFGKDAPVKRQNNLHNAKIGDILYNQYHTCIITGTTICTECNNIAYITSDSGNEYKVDWDVISLGKCPTCIENNNWDTQNTQIITRYPNDYNAAPLVRDTSNTNNSATNPTTSSTTSTTASNSTTTAPASSSLLATSASAHANSDMNCAVCGTVIWNAGFDSPNSNMGAWDDVKDVGVCKSCQPTSAGRKALYG